jgi:hypothetical protein
MVLDGKYRHLAVTFEAKVRAVAEAGSNLANVPVYDWFAAENAEAVERCAMIDDDISHYALPIASRGRAER